MTQILHNIQRVQRHLNFFRLGVFEHAMGTNIFFAENTDPPPMDPNFESIPSTMYKYHSQTDKVLKMERIFITPKQDNDEDDDTTEEQCEEDDIPNESYLEALNHFLKPRELPPRTMSGSDILKPAEFKAFFRPQLDEVAVDEQSEQVNDSMETNDNNEMIETSASEASGSATTELSAAQVKIENIKLEQQ